jgi:hypothetical protein
MKHSCHLDKQKHSVCACGWISPGVGSRGVAESFAHFEARKAVDAARAEVAAALDKLLALRAEMPADDVEALQWARQLVDIPADTAK